MTDVRMQGFKGIDPNAQGPKKKDEAEKKETAPQVAPERAKVDPSTVDAFMKAQAAALGTVVKPSDKEIGKNLEGSKKEEAFEKFMKKLDEQISLDPKNSKLTRLKDSLLAKGIEGVTIPDTGVMETKSTIIIHNPPWDDIIIDVPEGGTVEISTERNVTPKPLPLEQAISEVDIPEVKGGTTIIVKDKDGHVVKLVWIRSGD
ncbi:MAG TPA: hypothetical protein PKI94_02055 [Candidatus Gastranaerophilaceae bacterium]|nr:hypothetical protein [Candidatus Gastranaerophilaceae bacterium]